MSKLIDLYDFVETISSIRCCNLECKNEAVTQGDEMLACEDFYQKGWRVAYDEKNEMDMVYCPKCAKEKIKK